MSKKLKAFIIFLLIVVVIGLVLGTSTIYKFCIIQDIFKQATQNILKENYYLKTTLTTNGNTSSTEVFYKDGIGKNVASNGVYTWTDGEKAYMVDEENKTIYNIDMNNNQMASILVSNEMFISSIPRI